MREKNSLKLTFEDVENAVTNTKGSFDGKYINHQNDSHSDINFKIKKDFGKLSERKNSPNFCLVTWDTYERYDLRPWKEDMSIPCKGMTFTNEEIGTVCNLISNFDFKHAGKTQYHQYSAGKAIAKIYESVGTVSSKEVNGVSWNKEILIVDWGYGIKVDIRKWTNQYEKCGKGLCITFDEAAKLGELIRETIIPSLNGSN